MRLVFDHDAAWLLVDYSLSTQQLYTGLAAYWVRQGKHKIAPTVGLQFESLHWRLFTKDRIANLPTWGLGLGKTVWRMGFRGEGMCNITSERA